MTSANDFAPRPDGPVTTTRLSLLAALGIVASLSQKKATITPILLHRYADTSRAPTPGEQGVLGNIGITPTSA
jgi:hypothetical protein